jgi:PAS domain S-box-containing protein
MCTRCTDARRGIESVVLLEIDITPSLAVVDDRLADVRGCWPALLRARGSPDATLAEARRLNAHAVAADDAIGEAISRIRNRLAELSIEMRESSNRATNLLISACVLAIVVMVLLFLRQRDITKLLEAQRERTLLDQRLNTVLENAPAVLWSTDRELRITSTHGAALREIGLEPGQVDGQTLQEYFGTDDLAFEGIARHKKALEGEPQRYEFRWAGRIFLNHVAPMYDAKHRIVGTIGLGLDVTELKEAERALADSSSRVRHLEKMDAIGRLADTVAHDFNNFLTVILGNAGLALNALPGDSPVRADVEEIARTAERAAQLTRQLLSFGRPRSFAPEPVDLNEVVRGLERILGRQCGDAIEIELRLSPAPVIVDAHPAQMEQIVLNLALNARDAMPDGGKLTISTARVAGPKPTVALSIRDTGIGMDEEVRQRLFEPFFTTKTQGPTQGTGLGLAIVDAIVRERGGSINVESAPGRGSTFRVQLPAAASATMPESTRVVAPVAQGGQGETVLLVEDDEAVRSLGRRALESNGYHVIEARGGEEAIDQLDKREEPIDLLLTDLRMPRMSGEALARWCLKRDPATKVILMSTHPEAEELDLGGGGPVAFLAKPFTSSELLQRVRETLDQAGIART